MLGHTPLFMDMRREMTLAELIAILAPVGAAIFVCILHNAVKIAGISKDVQWIKKILDINFNQDGGTAP